MKTLCASILLVVALATPSAALGQVQRWEYAILAIQPTTMTFEYGALRLSTAAGLDAFILGVLDGAAADGEPPPGDWVLYAGEGEMLILSILGATGWEVTSTAVVGNARMHYLKRPL